MPQYINPNKFWKRKFYQDFRFFNKKVPKFCDWKKMYIDEDKALLKSRIVNKKFDYFFNLPPEIILEILHKLDNHSLKCFSITAKKIEYRDEMINIRDFTDEIWKYRKLECIAKHSNMKMLDEILNEKFNIDNINTNVMLGIFNDDCWISNLVNEVLYSDNITCSDDELFVYKYRKSYFFQVTQMKLSIVTTSKGESRFKKFVNFVEYLYNNRSVYWYSVNFTNMLYEKLIESKDKNIRFEVYYNWYMYKIFNIELPEEEDDEDEFELIH